MIARIMKPCIVIFLDKLYKHITRVKPCIIIVLDLWPNAGAMSMSAEFLNYNMVMVLEQGISIMTTQLEWTATPLQPCSFL